MSLQNNFYYFFSLFYSSVGVPSFQPLLFSGCGSEFQPLLFSGCGSEFQPLFFRLRFQIFSLFCSPVGVPAFQSLCKDLLSNSPYIFFIFFIYLSKLRLIALINSLLSLISSHNPLLLLRLPAPECFVGRFRQRRIRNLPWSSIVRV